jgi:hypothetical protein
MMLRLIRAARMQEAGQEYQSLIAELFGTYEN